MESDSKSGVKRRRKRSKKKPQPTEQEEKVDLRAWIGQKIAANKHLRPEQRKEIEVFMKRVKGLRDREPRSKYEKAFESF